MGVTYGNTGWKSPSSAFWSKYGDYCAEWIYPTRIKSINNSGATLPSGEGINIKRKTAYLVAHGFDFSSIPSNATITGVEVKIVRKKTTNGGTAKDHTVKLRYGTTSKIGGIGLNKAKSILYSKSYETSYYGGRTDKWGANLTRSIVTSSSFGVFIRCVGTVRTYSNVAVDGIQMRVHYSVVTPDPAPQENDPDPNPTLPPENQVIPEGYGVIGFKYSSGESVSDTSNWNNLSYIRDSDGLYASCTNTGTIDVFDATMGDIILPNVSGFNITGIETEAKYKQTTKPSVNTGGYFGSNVYVTPDSKKSDWVYNLSNILEEAGDYYILNTMGEGQYAETLNINTFNNPFTVGTDVIKGIQVQIKYYVSSPNRIRLDVLRLRNKNNTGQYSNNLGYNTALNSTSETTITFGSTSNLWTGGDASSTWQTFLDNFDPANLEIQMVYRNTPGSGGSATIRIFWVKLIITYESGIRVTTFKVLSDGNPVGNELAETTLIPTNDVIKRYGGYNNNLGISDLNSLKDKPIGIRFGVKNACSTSSTALLDYLKLRIFYQKINEGNVVTQSSCNTIMDYDNIGIEQGDALLESNLRPISCNKKPIKIESDSGYIGMVKLDRTHNLNKKVYQNIVEKESVRGIATYSKKYDYNTSDTIEINVPTSAIETLKGLVESDEIVPINTYTKAPDTDPYIHRGYALLSKITTEYINPMRSKIELDLEYITNNLYTPLKVEYNKKTELPVEIDNLPDYYNTLYEYKINNMNLIENSVTFYSDESSSKTLEPDKITFTLPNSTSYQKFITNDTLNFGFKYKTKFRFNRNQSQTHETTIYNPSNPSQYLKVTIEDANMHIVSYNMTNNVNRTVSLPTLGSNHQYADITLEIKCSSTGNITIELNYLDNENISGEYIETNITINNVQYKIEYKVSNMTSSQIVTYLYDVSLYKNLFTDSYTLALRNIIHTPETIRSSIEPTFTRYSEDGEIKCYVNPDKDMIYYINPLKYYIGAVKVINLDTGAQIYSPRTTISMETRYIELSNGTFKLIFDFLDKTIDIYSFIQLTGWVKLGQLSTPSLFYPTIKYVSSDKAIVNTGEIDWILEKGKKYVTIKHPNQDLQITDSIQFNRYWCVDSNLTGNSYPINTGDEPIDLANMFFANIYSTNYDYGLTIIRTNGADIKSKNITKNEETIITQYTKTPVDNNEHFINLVCEAISSTSQKTSLKFN